jgi:hypothetical protein
MTAYWIAPDGYGDTALWAGSSIADAHCEPIAMRHSTHPDVWAAAVARLVPPEPVDEVREIYQLYGKILAAGKYRQLVHDATGTAPGGRESIAWVERVCESTEASR